MLGHRQLGIEDYLAIARRRFWLLILPPVLVCIGGYMISFLVPNRYTSQTQVLVQAQQIPTSIVQPIVTEQVDDRFASMREQILSHTQLQSIIEHFDLYANTRMTPDEKVQKLHDAIEVDDIRPMEGTKPGQLPGFRITVTMHDRYVAQKVCAEITSMFRDEQDKSRENVAQVATSFLDKELEDATNKMNDKVAKLAAFKSKYFGSLPDDVNATLGMLGSANAELESVSEGLERDISARSLNQSLLDQQVTAWKAQVASPEALSPDTLHDQLKKAQDQLANLYAQSYTDQWPAVKAKKAEIEDLKKQIAVAEAVKPPDTQREKAADPPPSTTVAEPQGIQQLRAQIAAINVAIQDKTKSQDELRSRIRTFEGRLQLSPVVEEQYKELTRDSTTATEEYNTLLKQRGTAARDVELEQRRQGEQFRILDPANLPEKPTFPNRLYFAAGGFAGGLGLGVALILLIEMRDKSLRTESDVELFLKLPTLAVVPVIDSKTVTKRFVVQTSKPGPVLEAKS